MVAQVPAAEAEADGSWLAGWSVALGVLTFHVVGLVQPIEENFQGQYTNGVSFLAHVVLPLPEDILANDVLVVQQVKYNTNKTCK